MVRMVLVCALLVVPVGPVGAQGTNDSVIGLWLGETRTEGGLGNWIEFRADGTVEFGFGALVGALLDDTYRLEGHTLTLRVFSGKVTPAGTPVFEFREATVQIDGDQAVLESQRRNDEPAPEIHSPSEQAAFERMRQPVKMTRVGPAPPGASPIAGTWSYLHYTGKTAYETFTPSGKWYLRVPLQLNQGRYVATPTAVTMRWTAQPSETFSRNGDVLMSGAPDGKHSSYRRAPE